MAKFSELIDVKWLTDLLESGKSVGEITKILEEKGFELGEQIESIEDLEGDVIHEGDLRILPECPMAPLLSGIKESNSGELPASFKSVTESYKKSNPNSAGILHPLCIVHQLIRKTYGMSNDEFFEQVSCRSTSSGEIVTSEAGLVMSGLSENEAKDMVKDKACMYFVGT